MYINMPKWTPTCALLPDKINSPATEEKENMVVILYVDFRFILVDEQEKCQILYSLSNIY